MRVPINRQIFQGNVLEQLTQFPDGSIDCIISSPPYLGLRDYSVEGQLGLEPDFHDYLNKMQTIMDELKRILKNTGTCWINLGDTYQSTAPNTKNTAPTNTGNKAASGNFRFNSGLQSKSRIGIPERFYINCIDSGWIARNHIVWTKNNSMPSSVKDRFTNKWESVFFFAKNRKYYFDLDAVREPTITPTKPFNARVRDSKKQRYLQKATDEEIKNHNGKGEFKGKASKEFLLKWQKNEDSIHGNNAYNPKGKNPGDVFYDKSKPYGKGEKKWDYKNMANGLDKHSGSSANHPKGKNPGDVFQINTKPFKEAHFATFPPGLPEKILKCSCPNQVCNKCGKPREAITKVVGKQITQNMITAGCNKDGGYNGTETKDYSKTKAQKPSETKKRILESMSQVKEIIGYTDCGCNAGFKPGIVLDPFFGSGTVGLVAEQMGLQWCGIELNPEYIEIAKKRLAPYTTIQKMDVFV